MLPPQSWAYDDDVPYDTIPESSPDARCRGLRGSRRRRALSPHDENLNRGVHAADGAVLQQQLRDVGIALDIRTFEFATFFADVTSGAFQFILCAGSAATKIPIFLSMLFTPTDFRPTAPTAVSIPIRGSTRLIDEARRETDQNVRKRCTLKFRKSWRKMCRRSTCGISTTCWCTRGVCGT
jgi:peptide/nickel transport system substrate-binding protein